MATTKAEPVDMKLEVVVIGVSDIDRAKAFYEKLGWRLDADIAGDRFPRRAADAAQLGIHRSSSAKESRQPSPARWELALR